MRLLHLYRPRLPSLRAQAIQILHTCHALAARGHAVTVLADRGEFGDGRAATPAEILADFGLDHPPGLDLRVAPTAWRPGAGLWFRWQVWRWCRGPGLVYARAKRYVPLIPARLPLVIEAHEVDSRLDAEAGRDPARSLGLERQALGRACGVVANCEGTLSLLEEAHPALALPRRVIHNATRADRQVQRQPAPEILVGYTGSPRAYKGLAAVFGSLPEWPPGAILEMVGGAPPGAPPQIRARPGVPYKALPAELARYHALLLPLEDNLFGRCLTSPLKLWDYLATGVPVVAADLPTTRAIGGDRLFYYDPRRPGSIAEALRRALDAGSAPPLLRTWAERAAEIEAFLAPLYPQLSGDPALRGRG